MDKLQSKTLLIEHVKNSLREEIERAEKDMQKSQNAETKAFYKGCILSYTNALNLLIIANMD